MVKIWKQNFGRERYWRETFLNSLDRNFGRKNIAEQNFQTELNKKRKKNAVGDRE